jgi:hypothetical protein
MTDVPGIHAALAEAAGRIGALAKTEKNKEQGFMFRSIEAILAHSKPVFTDLGISVTPRTLEKEYQEVTAKSGARGWRCTLTMEYTFSLGSDGSERVTSMPGEAIDYGDKSTSKAAQMAYKYALTQVLQIGSADADPDGESPESVASENPPADAGTWLASAVQMFKEWSVDDRRETVSQVMKELGVSNPMSMDDARLVHKQASEIYYETHPPTGDEAPF